VGLAKFSASANGVLVYQGGLMAVALTWVDRSGKRLGTLGDPGEISAVEFSPDRKHVAVTARDSSAGNTDIWLYDTANGLGTRFTFDPATDAVAVWSPKGDSVVFRSNRQGPTNLYAKPADGSRNEELLYADSIMKSTGSFSSDGKNLAYFSIGDPKTGYDIWILPDPLHPGAQKPYLFLHSESDENNPQFSPDGHWVAYQSNESGRFEVYVVPFPGPGAKRQISTKGGTLARWRPDGKELYFVAPDKHLMAAQVDAKGSAFAVTGIEPLFGPLLANAFSPNYDVADNGRKFLVVLPVESEGADSLTVVQNWAASTSPHRPSSP
jgi:Tol biopolymer transport system component